MWEVVVTDRFPSRAAAIPFKCPSCLLEQHGYGCVCARVRFVCFVCVYFLVRVCSVCLCVLVRVSFLKRPRGYLLLLRGLASKQSVFGTLLAVKAYMELDLQRRYRLYILDAAYSERAFTWYMQKGNLVTCKKGAWRHTAAAPMLILNEAPVPTERRSKMAHRLDSVGQPWEYCQRVWTLSMLSGGHALIGR